MSRTGWKQVERNAAALIGAKRHWANAGEREDADSPYFAAQVKNTKQLPLDQLTCLVEEMIVLGINTGRIPIVFVKQSARRPTPLLVVLPADAWFLLWKTFGLEDAVTTLSLDGLQQVVREIIKTSPGLRKRVAAFVEKSKKRGRR